MRDNLTFTFHIKGIAFFLGTIILVLTACNLLIQLAVLEFGYGNLFGLRKMFSVGQEANVPTFYSAIQLLVSAGLLSIITQKKWNTKDRYRFAWAGLAIGFLILALDEAAMIHELGYRLPAIFGFRDVPYAWLVPFTILLLFLVVVYWKFLWSLDGWTRRMFLLSAGIFLGGAMGMEVVGDTIRSWYGSDNWAYVFEEAMEELMEMAGIAIFILVLLHIIENEIDTFMIKITGGETVRGRHRVRRDHDLRGLEVEVGSGSSWQDYHVQDHATQWSGEGIRRSRPERASGRWVG